MLFSYLTTNRVENIFMLKHLLREKVINFLSKRTAYNFLTTAVAVHITKHRVLIHFKKRGYSDEKRTYNYSLHR